MAGNQLIAPLPALTLASGCTVTVEAINSTTGAAVTGVTVSQVAFRGVNEATDYDTVPPAPEDPLPLFVPIPDTEETP